jgi:O-antigen ligase
MDGALALLILTYVWRVQDLFSVLHPLQLASLGTLGATGLFVAGGGMARLEVARRQPVYRWAVALLVMMVLSVPFALFPGAIFRFILEDHLKTFLMMTLIAASLRGAGGASRMAGVHVAGAVVYCLVVISRFPMVGGRLQSLVYYDSNDLGMLLVCTLPLAVYFLRPGERGWVRLMALGGAGVILLGLVRSGSRGGTLGLLTVCVYMLLRFSVFSKKARLGALMAGVGALVFLGGAAYRKQMETLLHPTQDYNWSGKSPEGRMEVWKRGVGYMLARPLTGVGASGFYVAEGTLSERAKRQQYGKPLKWSAPHNSFVQAGAELGFPGLFIFLGLLFVAFRRPKHDGPVDGNHAALERALSASILGYAVTGFFLSQAYAALLYTLLGIIVGLRAFAAVPAAAAAAAQTSAAPARVRVYGRRGGGWGMVPPLPPAV